VNVVCIFVKLWPLESEGEGTGEEETEVGRSGVWSESLGLVCGGIALVSVGTDVGGELGVAVDDPACCELEKLLSSRSKSIYDPTLGPREVEMYQCRRGC